MHKKYCQGNNAERLSYKIADLFIKNGVKRDFNFEWRRLVDRYPDDEIIYYI